MQYHKVNGSKTPKYPFGSKAIHKVSAVKRREAPEAFAGLKVSNAEFLSEIFRDTSNNQCCWTTFFADQVESKNKGEYATIMMHTE